MEQRREVVEQFMGQGVSVAMLCEFAGISKSCFYYSKQEKTQPQKGRPVPGFTVNRDGAIVLDKTIEELLKAYRKEPEFMSSGGYYKLSKYLAVEHGFYINHKKIYRICDENKLLLFKQDLSKPKKKQKKRCVYKEVSGANQLWQFDIKYGYVHGESKWFFVLAFIDVFSKKVTGYYIGKSCKAGDLVFTLNQALKDENITASHNLKIRSDNGPQMSSNKFYFYLKRLEQKLEHEFIPPRTPDRNAFIEAFFSILEMELLQARYFKTFKEAYETVTDFICFYNNRRLHGSIGFKSPKMFLEGIKKGEILQNVISA